MLLMCVEEISTDELRQRQEREKLQEKGQLETTSTKLQTELARVQKDLAALRQRMHGKPSRLFRMELELLESQLQDIRNQIASLAENQSSKRDAFADQTGVGDSSSASDEELRKLAEKFSKNR